MRYCVPFGAFLKTIPIAHPAADYLQHKTEIDTAIFRVIDDHTFILGSATERFEKRFARYCGADDAIALGSGTDALLVGLLSLGVGSGDEVIVPAFTFFATAEVVSFLGAKVVFADVDAATGLIAVDSVKERITSRTVCIIPVHLYGQLAPMNEFKTLVRKRSIALFEDAAQAHGAEYKGKRSPHGILAAYSFYPSKNLGAFGDAGALVTSEAKIARMARVIRNHGQKLGQKYIHERIGFNLRMDDIQAAILTVKLRYLKRTIDQRVRLAHRYTKLLSMIGEVEPMKILSGNKSSYHLYTIRAKKRDALKVYLDTQGIQSRVHYPLPVPLQPAYRSLGWRGADFPGALALSRSVLSLPFFPEMTVEQIETVVECIRRFYSRT